MMKHIIQYSLTVLVPVALVFVACTKSGDVSSVPDGFRVSFQGLVKNTKVMTRSDFNEDDFVLINSSSDANFGEISICRSVVTEPDVISEYVAADGMEGRLAPDDPAAPLVWYSRVSEHVFYAWTHPSVRSETSVAGGVEMDPAVPTQGLVTFGIQKDTGLEQFIVARNGPISYESNGLYVGLMFYRPVAKIQIDSITHISSAGNLTPLKKCRIDFPNLLGSARFDAKRNRVPDGNQGDVWLRDGDPGYEDTPLGLSWNWDMSSPDVVAGDYAMYLHPFEFGTDDADGSQPDETQPGFFSITAEVEGTDKVYFASLASLVDVRELQAGQFMKMNITVIDGGMGGIGCRIVDWNTTAEQTVSHQRPGIYSQEDAEELLNILMASPLDTDALSRFCRNGNIIHLYTHIDWSSLTELLNIPEGYQLDGQGYYVVLGNGGSIGGDVVNLRIQD